MSILNIFLSEFFNKILIKKTPFVKLAVCENTFTLTMKIFIIVYHINDLYFLQLILFRI